VDQLTLASIGGTDITLDDVFSHYAEDILELEVRKLRHDVIFAVTAFMMMLGARLYPRVVT
jgi:hypothetical protein